MTRGALAWLCASTTLVAVVVIVALWGRGERRERGLPDPPTSSERAPRPLAPVLTEREPAALAVDALTSRDRPSTPAEPPGPEDLASSEAGAPTLKERAQEAMRSGGRDAYQRVALEDALMRFESEPDGPSNTISLLLGLSIAILIEDRGWNDLHSARLQQGEPVEPEPATHHLVVNGRSYELPMGLFPEYDGYVSYRSQRKATKNADIEKLVGPDPQLRKEVSGLTRRALSVLDRRIAERDE